MNWKRFLSALLVTLFAAIPAIAADKMTVLTFELYNSSVTYTQTGGVTTVASGVSELTCTYNGTKAATLDNRTINLDSFLGSESKTFVVQLGANYIVDATNGTYNGVTLYRGSGAGTWAANAGVTGQIGLAFSSMDNARAWSGTSVYWIWHSAMSGNSLYMARLQDQYLYETQTTSVSPFWKPVITPISRYMRAYWRSGLTPFRRVPITLTISK